MPTNVRRRHTARGRIGFLNWVCAKLPRDSYKIEISETNRLKSIIKPSDSKQSSNSKNIVDQQTKNKVQFNIRQEPSSSSSSDNINIGPTTSTNMQHDPELQKYANVHEDTILSIYGLTIKSVLQTKAKKLDDISTNVMLSSLFYSPHIAQASVDIASLHNDETLKSAKHYINEQRRKSALDWRIRKKIHSIRNYSREQRAIYTEKISDTTKDFPLKVTKRTTIPPHSTLAIPVYTRVDMNHKLICAEPHVLFQGNPKVQVFSHLLDKDTMTITVRNNSSEPYTLQKLSLIHI